MDSTAPVLRQRILAGTKHHQTPPLPVTAVCDLHAATGIVEEADIAYLPLQDASGLFSRPSVK